MELKPTEVKPNMQLKNVRARIKSPVEAFRRCPACGTSLLVPLGDEQVSCRMCDWDSVEIHTKLLAEAGF